MLMLVRVDQNGIMFTPRIAMNSPDAFAVHDGLYENVKYVLDTALGRLYFDGRSQLGEAHVERVDDLADGARGRTYRRSHTIVVQNDRKWPSGLDVSELPCLDASRVHQGDASRMAEIIKQTGSN